MTRQLFRNTCLWAVLLFLRLSAHATTVTVYDDPATAPPCGNPPASAIAQTASCAARVDELEAIQTVAGPKYIGVCQLTYHMPNGALDSSNDYTLTWKGQTPSTTESGAHPNVCECQKLLAYTKIGCTYAGGGVPGSCDPFGSHSGDVQMASPFASVFASVLGEKSLVLARRYTFTINNRDYLLVLYDYTRATVPALAQPGDNGFYFAHKIDAPYTGRFDTLDEMTAAYAEMLTTLNHAPALIATREMPGISVSLELGLPRSIPLIDSDSGFSIRWQALTSMQGGFLGYGVYPRLIYNGSGDPDVVLIALRSKVNVSLVK